MARAATKPRMAVVVNTAELESVMTEEQQAQNVETEVREPVVAREPLTADETQSGLDKVAQITNETKAHVEGVTAFMLRVIEDAESQLSILRATVLDDAARIKMELDAHVLSAEGIRRQMQAVVDLTKEIRGRRDGVLLNHPPGNAS